MIQKINIEDGLSKGCCLDIKGAIQQASEQAVSPRLVRIPVDDFQKAVKHILDRFMMPFQPMCFGLPCEPFERTRPALVCVADDDTNIEQETVRTTEFSPLEA